MQTTAIITDSDASLPPALAEQYGIQQVPITVHFGDESYTTSVDIDDVLLFQKIDKLNKLPTTAAPSPGAFAAAYESALSAGAQSVVCICVSSKVSATYNAAVTAAEQFPGREIRVVDSLNLSMGQGFMVLAAAEAAQAGANVDEIVAQALDTGSRVHVYAVLATLKYLALSGRVGKLAAGMADTLNIKPVLSVRDGKLDLLEKIRTRKKAVERMLELTRQSLDGKRIERLGIIHVTNPEGAAELRDLLRAALPCPEEIIIAEFTAGLSVHAGSGVVGLALVAGK